MKNFLILISTAYIFNIYSQENPSYTDSPPNIQIDEYYLFEITSFPCSSLLNEKIDDYDVFSFNFLELYTRTNSNDYFTQFILHLPEKSYKINIQRNDLGSPNYSSTTSTT